MSRGVRTVLVANRGEIARRVVRACRVLGLRSVAAHSDADASLPFVREADASERLGPGPARESYLDGARVLDAARRAGADAIHPGYGFLSENPEFAAAVEDAGLVFVGPSAATLRALGDKTRARRAAREAGVPVNEGSEPLADAAAAIAAARKAGYPVLLKAAAGGGGRGMRAVHREEDLDEALRSARDEARASFGKDAVFLERLVRPARHVEVQVFGDGRGAVRALGERECSVQRRHQKVLEEAPSPAVDPALRARLGAAAEAVCSRAKYRGAGTVEFLLAPSGEFFFLEVNGRLQVEHPVTEMVLGADLVAAQLLLAREGTMPDLPAAEPRGWAVEARVNAEDPAAGFAPSPGRILALDAPRDAWVRWDAGYETGDEVPPHYDSLLGKLIAWGPTRAAAVARLRDALARLVVLGPATNAAYLAAVLAHPAFAAGRLHTGFLEEHFEGWTGAAGAAPDDALLAAAASALLHAAGAAPGAGPGRRAAAGGGPSPWDGLPGWRA